VLAIAVSTAALAAERDACSSTQRCERQLSYRSFCCGRLASTLSAPSPRNFTFIDPSQQRGDRLGSRRVSFVRRRRTSTPMLAAHSGHSCFMMTAYYDEAVVSPTKCIKLNMGSMGGLQEPINSHLRCATYQRRCGQSEQTSCPSICYSLAHLRQRLCRRRGQRDTCAPACGVREMCNAITR